MITDSMIVPVTPSQARDIDVLPPGLGPARHPGRLTACRTEAASLSLRTQARIQARISWPAQSVAADGPRRASESRSESRRHGQFPSHGHASEAPRPPRPCSGWSPRRLACHRA
jgi:hypothetical protein